MIKSISRALLPRAPARLRAGILFMEYLPGGCAEQRGAIIHCVLHDTRSTSTVVTGRGEGERSRGRKAWSALSWVRDYARGYTLMHVLRAEIYVGRAIPFSPHRNVGNAPATPSPHVCDALSLMNRLRTLVTFHISLMHR